LILVIGNNSFIVVKIRKYERQIAIVEEGGKVVQETRLWDDNSGTTNSMRGKEDAHDYRYFPEPDLVPLKISQEWIDEIKKSMPELPAQRIERYKNLGLSQYDADIIVAQMEIAFFLDDAIKLGANPKIATNFLMGEVSAFLKEEKITIDQSKLTAENFAKLLKMIEDGKISNNIAKGLIIEILKSGEDACMLVEKKGLSVISNSDEILTIIQKIVAQNPENVAAYKSGKDKLFGFFVGQVMKETKGRANPAVVNELLKKELEK
jgi:aspartyl-tRNA(Asn)/glutamyl-tRNA(Gln) amidotransferase subunit B